MKLFWAVLATGLIAGCGDRPSYNIIGDEIRASLSSSAGDPVRGQAIFLERDQGHCVICHQVAGLEISFQGNVGPDLSDVGARLTPAQLRLRIVDMSAVTPGTLMPSYFRTDHLNQVAEEFSGETILSAQQIEDLVAYLASLETGP
ncbi:MAG: sulfur oxidation c-type cytochrome SoxX [Pseudomonadota bacterium]